MTESDSLEVGLSPTEAIAAFEAACSRTKSAERLFITDSWFAPFRARLLAALPPRLDVTVLEALRDAVYKRHRLEIVIDFVEQQPMTWEEFGVWKARRDRAVHLEQAQRGFFPWSDVEASAADEQLQAQHHSQGQRSAPAILSLGSSSGPGDRAARDCPGCGRPSSELNWIYFSSPAWTWQQLCGRAGWMTVCWPCHLQVDFFLSVMN